jgi:hypothetical protein
MKKLLVAINNNYGGFPFELKREYSSVKEFQKDCKIAGDDAKAVQLLAIELADNEYYVISEYDGWENIHFKKKEGCSSRILAVKSAEIPENTYKVYVHNKLIQTFSCKEKYLDIALEDIALQTNTSVFNLKRELI